MAAPQLSIVMPSLNQGPYLRQAIESVLTQSLDDDVELLVMDGGSSDESLAILRSYGSRLSYVSEPDRGQSDALNKGLQRARGEVLGWLNSDDLYQPDALRRVMTTFRDPGVQWVYGNVDVIDAAGVRIRNWVTRRKNRELSRLSFGKLLEANWISQMGVFWRRSLQETAGPLRTDLHLAMDYDLWLRFWRLVPGTHLDALVASFRLHPSSKTRQNSARQLDEAFRIARSHASPDHRWHLLRHWMNALLIRGLYRFL
jgi:glycosyltransferase involved in cell wall biosynthesis